MSQKIKLDRDLKERLDSFGGYGIETWVKQEVQSLVEEIQFLRDKLEQKKRKITIQEIMDDE